jgi:outer membrane immunogenic protein
MVSPLSVHDWSGFYIGANVGGAWDNGTATNAALDGAFVSSGTAHNSGVIGGGQIGYDYMVSPSFLLGIEADVDGTSLKGSVLSIDGSNQHSSKLDAFGTVRGRVGFAQNNWLFYGTGGFAWSEGSVTRTQIATVAAVPPIPAPAGTVETTSNTRTGWAAGAGVEWGVTQNWTARGRISVSRSLQRDISLPALQQAADQQSDDERGAGRRELQVRRTGGRTD